MLEHSQHIVLFLLDHLLVLIEVQALHSATSRHTFLHGLVGLDDNVFLVISIIVVIVVIVFVAILHSHILFELPVLLAVCGVQRARPVAVAVGGPVIERNAVLRRHRQAAATSSRAARSAPASATARAATRAAPALRAGCVLGHLFTVQLNKRH